MENRLDGQIALVTGASRGIGAASAEWLAGRGAHVVAVARTIGGLEELDDRIQTAGGSATLAPMDVTDENAMAHFCRSIHDRWGKADIWVHTAFHASALTPTPHLTAHDLDTVIATNIRALARLIALIDPLITPSPAPKAVFFDSDWDAKFASAYGLSKAAGRALVESWQAETLRDSLAVHLLRPAPMPTAIRARFYPGEPRDRLASPKEEAARLLPAVFDT
ncbi:SDR family oxidoreductase [Rhodophyticola sp. CCM32]|uniref:SDR family NAD(P)-dependent oxidoreductase n=1 Tax=Rhodophyticola sp. CCM32 TaxID=2916397 RepID=UPI00107F15B6|nr:SDR family oxidoreductase [Rhodophyticola sp. CCM32]QBX99812.1 SDR family oxidoreductase [Rhodophyticola sp. CCM32]